MSIETTAYGYDNKGKLAVFRINKEDKIRSFKSAIGLVKEELGTNRAMCLVKTAIAEKDPIETAPKSAA